MTKEPLTNEEKYNKGRERLTNYISKYRDYIHLSENARHAMACLHAMGDNYCLQTIGKSYVLSFNSRYLSSKLDELKKDYERCMNDKYYHCNNDHYEHSFYTDLRNAEKICEAVIKALKLQDQEETQKLRERLEIEEDVRSRHRRY